MDIRIWAPLVDPCDVPLLQSSGGSGCAGAGAAAGARGGSLRTPLARTPVTFNASQVATWARRGGATGRPASCRTCPRPPSARPKRAASPRCRPWRRLDAQAWAARASSSSGAASTSSASCAPTATPTPRSTTATTSSDRMTASAAVRRQTDVTTASEPRPASSWSRAHGSDCTNGVLTTASLSDSRQTDHSAATSWNRTCVSDVTTAHVGGHRVTKLSADPSWNCAHASDVTNGVEPATTAPVGCSHTTDPSWNFLEVQNSDSVRGRRTTACVQTVPTSHRAKATVHVSDVKNLSASALRPPLPFNAHHHRNDFLMPGNVTNIVPNIPVYSLNAQNHIPHNEGRNNFNTHTCSNVPNWNRSVDILKALHSAVPHNSNQDDDRNVRQTSNVGRPIFDIYAVSSENLKEDYCRDIGNQNYYNPTLYYRSKPEEATSSCTCVPISIPRVSSWSFTKKTVATTPTVYPNGADFETTHQYAKNNMIKIQSADNIRRLQFINASVPTTSGQVACNKRTIYPPNDNDTNAIYCPQISPKGAICHQPRENNVAQIQIPNLGGKNVLPDSAKNSVVHWTSSVENRVCCPETVLYGAVYGLKCLK
nr:uncharacterized protein LOC117993232 [Maniola hyperantus]